jgi:ribosomal protein S15P/S13E
LDSLKLSEFQRQHRDEVEVLNREIDRLKRHIKNHRQDNETKLAELSRTIQLLSSKSELHNDLTQTRRDLQLEKLLVENLRRDVETYQSMLTVEQSRCERLKKELLNSEAANGRAEILRSLDSVPGIPPARLIEIFSDKLNSLETELLQLQSQQRQSSKLNSVSPSSPSSIPLAQSFTEEIRKVLSSQQIEDFLPSLNNALLLQRILDLESFIKEQDLRICDLNKGEEQQSPLEDDSTPHRGSSNEKLLILTQESLAQCKNDIKHLKYQLELSQEKEIAANCRLRSMSVSAICMSCQSKICSNTEAPGDEIPVFDLDRSDGNITTPKDDYENLKSLLRERTTQVCFRFVFSAAHSPRKLGS